MFFNPGGGGSVGKELAMQMQGPEFRSQHQHEKPGREHTPASPVLEKYGQEDIVHPA